MMEKSILEKRIHEKAVERFDKDIRDFINFVGHSELRNFSLGVVGYDSKIGLAAQGCNWGIINTEPYPKHQEWLKEHTNFYEIKEQTIKKYEKEETDKILGKLENLDYLWRE